LQTLSTKSFKLIKLNNNLVLPKFPLPWSHYALLLAVKSDHAGRFYEGESLEAAGRHFS